MQGSHWPKVGGRKCWAGSERPDSLGKCYRCWGHSSPRGKDGICHNCHVELYGEDAINIVPKHRKEQQSVDKLDSQAEFIYGPIDGPHWRLEKEVQDIRSTTECLPSGDPIPVSCLIDTPPHVKQMRVDDEWFDSILS